MADARVGADAPCNRTAAAVGLLAAVSSFVSCVLCVVASGYAADDLAIVSGVVAALSVLVTMVCFELDGDRGQRRRLSLAEPALTPPIPAEAAAAPALCRG